MNNDVQRAFTSLKAEIEEIKKNIVEIEKSLDLKIHGLDHKIEHYHPSTIASDMGLVCMDAVEED